MIVSDAGPSDRVPPYRFALRTRVEITDTDLGEVVYYGRYSVLVDRAVVAYRRYLGIPPLGPPGHFFVVRHWEMSYRASAVFDDLLEIHVRVVKLGRASHTVHARIDEIGGEEPRLLAEGVATITGLTHVGGRPTRIPDEMVSLIRGFEDPAGLS